MSKPITVGLVGIGGYGHSHLSALRTLQGAGLCRLVAVADPFAGKLPFDVAALKTEGVEIYDAAEQLCAREDIEAVFIATPIPLHVPQTLLALESGKNVYLEKPPCATLGELAQLLEAQARQGKICAVGFQQQAAPATQFIKKQIRAEAIGALKTVHASVRWRRNDAYYGRAAWAGKWRLGAQPVFDGPATNALAHVVHAALFLAGEEESAWAGVLRVRGSLKKARAIESYDTAYLEVETASGVLVRLAFTHASSQQDDVVVNCVGESGSLSLNWNGEVVYAPQDGAAEEYLFAGNAHYATVLNFFHALRQEQAAPATALENTQPYLQAVNGALQSSNGAAMFDSEMIQSVGESPHRHFTVTGLDAAMVDFAQHENAISSLLPAGPWINAADISEELIV